MDKTEIFNIICEHTREVVPELTDHNFCSDDSLEKLGANSIDRSEIVIMTLESLNLKIPLVDTIGAKNIGQLANILYEKL